LLVIALTAHEEPPYVRARFWPGEAPIGRRLKFGPPESDKPWIEIVGVVGDTR
jgi:hypothetical protein